MRIVLCLLAGLLSACHQGLPKQEAAKPIALPYRPTAKDGPPRDAKTHVFKKVSPKYEPLSQYGNPMYYSVAGKKYTVMRTASGYKTRGLASWYGTKFHSQRTSSGEHYDMYAMTAAHNTLPLPTYLRVKNLANSREVIVKVNDRGPFHSNRLIDLSYAAATKLGMLPKGTARVEIEALNVKQSGQPKVAHYFLQAGAFQSSKFAQQLRDKLAKLSPSPVFIEQNRSRYLVRVGPFANQAMCQRLHRLLEAKGVHGSIAMLL